MEYTGLSFINSLYSADGDIYAAGSKMDAYGYQFGYYINDSLINTSPEYYRIMVGSMTVLDGDVYVVGAAQNNLSVFVPVYWKNGVRYALYSSKINGYATDIFIKK